MSNKKNFEDITGMWRRKKSIGGKSEVSYYGQIREDITLKAGDKIQMYETRARNRRAKDPQFHLKVLRASATESQD